MAEKKTKKDLEEKRAEKVADEISLKAVKADLAETDVKVKKVEAKQDDVAAKQEVADMLDDQVKAEPKTAKAGKRSAKGLAEAEEKKAKIERQKDSSEDDSEAKPKKPVTPTRSRLERRSKKYKEAHKNIEADKVYAIKPAVTLLPKVSTAKFDATAELHIRLNVDPKQADQNIRDTIVLPAGTGKEVRVAVFADQDDLAAAKKAGADIAGGDDFLAQLDKGTINFDVLIAKPQVMAKLGKYARILGPKGLMPNPKSGTVTTDIEKAIKEAKAGRVEYRVDEAGIVHVAFGKLSFGAEKLTQNLEALLKNIKSNKPSSVKGAFVATAYLSATMGPSVQLDINELNNL